MSDPTNMDALEEIQFNTGYTTELILTDEKSLQACIEKILEEQNEALSLDINDLEAKELLALEVQGSQEEDEQPEKDDPPIVVYINKILLDAIKKGASDLHFEPYEKTYRIRFRIDGILSEVATPPNFFSVKNGCPLKSDGKT